MQHISISRLTAGCASGQVCVPPPWVSNSILLVIALQALLKCAAGLGLYGDGSYFLLRLLEVREISTYDWHRWFAQVVTQGPLVLSLRAGLEQMNLVIYLHSLGLIAIPAALWMLSLHKLRATPLFWPVLVVFSIAYFNSSLFAIGEYNLAFAITAAVFAILIQPGALAARDGAILVACSIISARCYESFVFLGVLLIGMAANRIFITRTASGHAPRTGARSTGELIWLGTAMVFLSCAVFLSGWSVFFPRDPGNLAAAADILGQLRNPQLAISLAVGSLYGLQLLASHWLSRTAQALSAIGLAGGLIFALAFLDPDNWSMPHHYYGNRTLCGVVVFAGLGAIAIWHFWRSRHAEAGAASRITASRSLWVLPSLLFGALLVPNLVHTYGFHDYLGRFQAELASRKGFVRIDSTALGQGKPSTYGWTWTNPSLSLLLRENEQQAIILNAQAVGWEPFDAAAEVPDIMPRIRKYRFNASTLFWR